MSTKDEINQAITAHGQWKQTLRSAISTGECVSTPEKVKMDNNCSFGKWLHERIDPDAKNTPNYPEIVDLHAQFHIEASKILTFALNGDQDQANELMKLTGEFSRLSAELTRKMKAWGETF